MGLLALGTPLNWEETKPLAEHIRYHGITQFLNTWNRWKDITGKGLLWGDEVSLDMMMLMVDRIYGSLV
jgi:glutamate--cysteine ligase catalytic subunit